MVYLLSLLVSPAYTRFYYMVVLTEYITIVRLYEVLLYGGTY